MAIYWEEKELLYDILDKEYGEDSYNVSFDVINEEAYVDNFGHSIIYWFYYKDIGWTRNERVCYQEDYSNPDKYNIKGLKRWSDIKDHFFNFCETYYGPDSDFIRCEYDDEDKILTSIHIDNEEVNYKYDRDKGYYKI